MLPWMFSDHHPSRVVDCFEDLFGALGDSEGRGVVAFVHVRVVI